MATKLPAYDELPVRAGAPKGSAWGVFGDDDQVGTINLLTAERVRQAAVEIRGGRIFPLNLPMEIPDPPRHKRGPLRRVLNSVEASGVAALFIDDRIDNFFPQASSQWDALAHVKHPEFGSYNGFPDAEVSGRGGTRLGIENFARRGIAGRGVLADVARYYERHGRRIDYATDHTITVAELEATLSEQKVSRQEGDILLIRIGWINHYLSAGEEFRAWAANPGPVPGIESGAAMARWLWNNHFAAVASDSPGLESVGSGRTDFLHFDMLALLGMPIGEWWDLEALAQDCAADGRYTCFLTSAPLNVRGALGSPPNALAIK